jgi:hypothetical protein
MTVVEYELTTEDLTAFFAYFNESTKEGRRGRLRHRLTETAVLVAVMMLIIGIGFHDPKGAAIFGVFGGVCAWFIAAPFDRSWSIRRAAERWARSSGPGATGHYTLTVDDAGVRELGRVSGATTSDTFVPWSDVLRLDETPNHAFIFMSPHRALVVPKRDDLASLAPALDEIRRRSGRPETDAVVISP